MREALILMCCAVASGVASESIRDIDWKNFTYPLLEPDGVPAQVEWMAPRAKPSISLINGRYVVLDNCGDGERFCPSITFDSVNYGALTGIGSPAAAVVLTYQTGGTAHWQYVYLFVLDSGKARLLRWLRTGSRADQGLRDLSINAGNLVLVVNDPEKRQGDCCAAGTIITRYRWTGSSFSAVGQPVYKDDPPSFDCAKAATPIEVLICMEVQLAFLDRQMANSYQLALKGASAERKQIIQRQQAEWFAEYSRACNARLSEAERRECIDRHLSHRLTTIWK